MTRSPARRGAPARTPGRAGTPADAPAGARAAARADAAAAARADAAAAARADAAAAARDADAAVACACGRLRRATRALTQLYDDAMAPAGLRITQFSLLRNLAQHGPLRIGDLAERTLLDRTALSRNLDALIARGFVAASPGRDARSRVVELTPAGRRELAAATPHWRRAQALVRERLGAARLDALIDTLHALESLHPHVHPTAEKP